MQRSIILGIDVGGPIIARDDEETDRLWQSEYASMDFLKVPPTEGAFEAIARLVKYLGETNVFLVSKSGALNQRKMHRWLADHDFYPQTGVSRFNTVVCTERESKSGMCQSLRITDMIDDRLEVLGKLPTVPRKYLFRGRTLDLEMFRPALQQVMQAEDWDRLYSLVHAR